MFGRGLKEEEKEWWGEVSFLFFRGELSPSLSLSLSLSQSLSLSLSLSHTHTHSQQQKQQKLQRTREAVDADDVPALERRDRRREPLDAAPEVARVGHHLHLDAVGLQVEEDQLALGALGVHSPGQRRRLVGLLLPRLESGLELLDVPWQRQRRLVLVGVRVLPRRARGGDRADTGLVELGRVDVVALVLFDKGRGSVVFGPGGGGRGVGLCGFVVEEREEKRRSGREEEEIRQVGKKNVSPNALSLFSSSFSPFSRPFSWRSRWT